MQPESSIESRERERKFCYHDKKFITANILEPPREMINDPDPRKVWYRSMWYSCLDTGYKIRSHLRSVCPEVDWISIWEIGFAHYRNTPRQLEIIAQTTDLKYKWGATANIERRLFELKLAKHTDALYYVVTSGIAESAQMEKDFIKFYNEHPVDTIRLRCLNVTKGGEGLGQPGSNRGAHFFYLAVKR